MGSTYVSPKDLAETISEKSEILRRAIASETTIEEERSAKLRSALQLYFVTDRREGSSLPARAEWVRLSIKEIDSLPNGSGVYALVESPIKAGGAESVTYCRHNDPRDRDRARSEGRSVMDEITTSVGRLLEEERITTALHRQRAEDAFADADRLQKTVRQKEDEIRLQLDRIQQLEREVADFKEGGLLNSETMTLLVGFAQNVIGAFQDHTAALRKRDANADRADKLADMFSRFASAVEAAPGAGAVSRDRRVRAIAEEFAEEFQEEIDEGEEQEETAVEGQDAATGDAPAPEEEEDAPGSAANAPEKDG